MVNVEIYDWISRAKYAAISLTALGFILDLASFKWRVIAQSLFHLEMVQICLIRLIPVKLSDSYIYEVFFDSLMVSLCLACDIKFTIISLLFSQILGNTLLSSFWMGEQSHDFIVSCISVILLAGLVNTLFLSLTIYASDLHAVFRIEVTGF